MSSLTDAHDGMCDGWDQYSGQVPKSHEAEVFEKEGASRIAALDSLSNTMRNWLL